MSVWFTSDHHFYHSNIIKYCDRPFSSVEEMNEEMVKRWNSVVKKSDFVFHLGDFSLAIRPVELFAQRLNGHKRLIPGNHDHCHPAHYGKRLERAKKMCELYENNGLSLGPPGDKGPLEIAGQKVFLNHMQYKMDLKRDEDHINYYDDRYDEYKLEDKGHWLLHGHVHEKWTMNKKMINVGVDVWDFYPVHRDKIEELIKKHPNGS